MRAKSEETKDGPARLTVDLCSTRRKKLRLLASIHDVSMAEMMRLMIDDYYKKSEVNIAPINFQN